MQNPDLHRPRQPRTQRIVLVASHALDLLVGSERRRTGPSPEIGRAFPVGGVNLDIMRRYVADASVHLVYLDPPFTSNANYNVLFAEKDGARPAEQKKGADKGIDGRIIFQGDKPGVFESVMLSVKAGKTGAAHVRDLKGVLEREKAAIGVLISMQEPTAPMMTEAATAGFIESATWGRKYPKIQLLTVAAILAGTRVEMPPIKQVGATFKNAAKSAGPKAVHGELPLSESAFLLFEVQRFVHGVLA